MSAVTTTDSVSVDELDATVAAADIARIAGVGRAAVSNWRRRFPDFPEPVGGSAASPLYPLAEVEAWFATHHRPFQVRPEDRVWQRIRGTVDELRTGDLVGCVGAFLVFLSREPGTWQELAGRPDDTLTRALAKAVIEALPELPGLPESWDGEWPGIMRAIGEIAEQHDPVQLCEFFFERYTEVQSRRLHTTPTPVADLMIRLTAASADSVLDPACGTGALLLAAAEAGASTLYGQDVQPAAVRLVAARLLLRGLSITVGLGDSLRDDALVETLADAVVCDPPSSERSWGYEELTGDPRWEYGLPPKGEPELAWAQHCLAHVRPGGHVAILLPASVAARRSGRRIRGNLLRSGVLRGLIRLPADLAQGAASDLWVLRRPAPRDRSPSHLLLVDCDDDLSVVFPAWTSFLDDPEREPPGPGRSVRIIDLLDEEIDLSPPRHLRDHLERRASADVPGLRERLRQMAGELADLLPDLEVSDEPAPPPMTTVAELAKVGVVAVYQSPLRMDLDQGDTPVLTARDLRRGRGPSGRTTRTAGLVTVESGDVVLAVVGREPVVRVITDEQAALGPQLLLLRADPQRLDPDFLAGFLRLAGMSSQRHTSIGVSRVDARRVQIPLLPLPAQHAYRDAFHRLADCEAAMREATAVAEKLVRLGFVGLAEGTLRPRVGGR